VPSQTRRPSSCVKNPPRSGDGSLASRGSACNRQISRCAPAAAVAQLRCHCRASFLRDGSARRTTATPAIAHLVHAPVNSTPHQSNRSVFARRARRFTSMLANRHVVRDRLADQPAMQPEPVATGFVTAPTAGVGRELQTRWTLSTRGSGHDPVGSQAAAGLDRRRRIRGRDPC